MDISKVSNEKKLQLSRTYFRGGFALLPFLWAINVCWFYKEAFQRPPYPEQNQIKKYVIYSFIGSFVCTVALICWVIVFQIKRPDWGELGEQLSFIMPVGVE